MIRKQFNRLFLLSAASMLLASCNVHEWPEELESSYPFILYMNFDDALLLYKEVYYTRADDSRADSDGHDIRYIVNVYRVTDENDNNRDVYRSFSFTQGYVANHDYHVALSLPEGRYRFRVWSDHVASGTQTDLYYTTSDFSGIYINESSGHPGNNEMRDAFRGNAYGEVYDPELYEIRNGVAPDNSATAAMQRPMGRYEFISTDMDEFLDKIVESVDSHILESYMRSKTRDSRGEVFWNGLTRDEVAEVAGLDNYKVVFSYNAFMPDTYNLYTDKPSDSATGVSYNGKMSVGDEGMQMGFDYILVDDQTTMNLNMQIYNGDGEMIANTNGVEVPVVRSKNTVVKGAFLTVTSGGGVTINPDFEGDDFNIEIK
ncbi:MAG: hypothetical protein J1F43_07945 [Muribaculaceae bacterium]|nr:hypothetical protein [Muribaculaceae bacterium]